MFVNSYSGLRFEVSVRGKEDFGEKCDEIHGNAWIIADSDKDIILDINCFKPEDFNEKVPALFIELYIDGILRNVVRPRTGRGMAEGQFAESTIDRGVVLTTAGHPQLKKFHFIDLDLDDAVLKCRLVDAAGKIEVRIIQAGRLFNDEDDVAFELPVVTNDSCAISMLCGELSNTVGLRFDDGIESFQDKKMEARLQSSIELMIARQNEMLGETLAIFSFQYGSDSILHHLGQIPNTHKRYVEEMANDRLELKSRLDEGLSPILIRKAVSDSDYTLQATFRDLKLIMSEDSDFAVPANSTCIIVSKKRQVDIESDYSPKKRRKVINTTPQKIPGNIQGPLTPPLTPGIENMIVCNMKRSSTDIV